MNFENKRCVVCFEEKKITYECDICKEGKMCCSCYCENWECCEDIFMEKTRQYWKYGTECLVEQKELLIDIIKCPCCRSPNWRQVYSSIFDYLIESDYYGMFKKNTSDNIKEFQDKLIEWFDEKKKS